jgi:arylsulfatase A-like enzyme
MEKDAVRDLARQRAGSLYAVDAAVKRIIGGLRATGQLDNTLIIFTSDNGYFLGEQGRAQGKILPYEPSLRVPVLMRGPGIPAGEVRTDPFLSIDFAPTLADLADAAIPNAADGQSLLDVARLGDESTGPAWSRVVLTETNPTRAAQKALEAIDPIGAQQTRQMRGQGDRHPHLPLPLHRVATRARRSRPGDHRRAVRRAPRPQPVRQPGTR